MRRCGWVLPLLLAFVAGPASGAVTVTGRALLADGRTPWRGARVSLQTLPSAPSGAEEHECSQEAGQALTGRDGRFRIGGVRPGGYALVVEGPASASGVRTRVLKVGSRPPRGVVLVRGRGVLCVRARWQDGGPLAPGASVTLARTLGADPCSPGALVARKRAGAAGECRFTGLEPGTYDLGAVARDPASGLVYHAQQAVKVPARPGAAASLILKPFRVPGTVLDLAGRPAAGALVVLGHVRGYLHSLAHRPEEGRYLRTTRADARGRFTFAGVGRVEDETGAAQGEYWLYARGEDGAEAVRGVWVGSDGAQDAPFTLRLNDRGIEGVVRTQSGGPVPGVLVTITPPRGFRHDGFFRVRSVTSAEGRFRFFDLIPGAYQATVHMGGEGLPATKQEIRVREHGRTEAAFVLPETKPLAGTLVRPDGRPASGVVVSLGNRRAASDREGRFAFADVLPGAYTLSAGHRHFPVKVPQEGEAEPIRLVVPAFRPRLAFDIRRPDGSSAAGTEVYAYLQRSGPNIIPFGYDARVVTDGKVTLGVEEGDVVTTWFLAPGVGYAMLDVPAVSALQEETRQVVRLQEGAYVRGRSVTAGRPAPGVLLVPRREGTDPAAARWNGVLSGNGPYGGESHFPSVVSREGDAAFELGPLPPGRYRVEVRDSLRGVKQELRVTLAEREVREGVVVEVPAIPNPASLSGRIVTRDGKPAARQRIYFRVAPTESDEPLFFESFQDPGQLRETVTGADGSFRLDPLPSRKLNVIAARYRHPRGGGLVVTLKPGENTGVRFVVRE